MMNKLTKSATSSYLLILIFNLFIAVLTATLVWNSIPRSKVSLPLQGVAPKIAMFAQKIKYMPDSRRVHLIRSLNMPLWDVSLSPKPRYPQQVVRVITKENVLRSLNASRQLQVSVQVSARSWLNFAQKNHKVIALPMVIFLGTLLILIFISINYWLVLRLNYSMQMVMQGLDYACQQKKWSPLPVIGDAEQQGVFKLVNELQTKSLQLIQNRSHMLAAISHDLRTPLTRLKLRVEGLQSDLQTQKMMQDISDMEVMIWETLDYFSEYNREAQKTKFCLSALLNTIIEEEQDKQHDISFAGADKRITYFANINLLKRAFENVINNALQHANKVNVSIFEESENIRIKIADNGKGIAEEDLQSIGTPFYQTHNSRTTGTGLGLMIANEVIKLHGGNIDFKNSSEGGLQVLINLPLENIR